MSGICHDTTKEIPSIIAHRCPHFSTFIAVLSVPHILSKLCNKKIFRQINKGKSKCPPTLCGGIKTYHDYDLLCLILFQFHWSFLKNLCALISSIPFLPRRSFLKKERIFITTPHRNTGLLDITDKMLQGFFFRSHIS